MPKPPDEDARVDHARREFLTTLQTATALAVPLLLASSSDADAAPLTPNDLGWYNVRDWGARRNNEPGFTAAGNTAAFQGAIDAVFTTGVAGVVYVPAGLYIIDQALLLRANVCIVGDSMRHSRIYQETNSQDVVRFNVGSGSRIATSVLTNVTLSHITNGTGSCLRTSRVDLVFCDRVQFRNGFRGCWIEDGINCFLHGCIANQQYGAGFYLRLNQNTLISHCHATEQVGGGTGFSIDASRGTSIVNCSATNTAGGPGFQVVNRYNVLDRSCTMSGCTANNNGMVQAANGFELVATAQVAMTGCVSMRNSGNGIYIGYRSQWISISGSQILNNQLSGIVSSDSSDVVVSGCIASDTQPAPTQRLGVYEAGSSDRTIVEGCIVRGNTEGQVALSGQNSIIGSNILG